MDHWYHVAPGKGVGSLLQSAGRRRPRSKRCPDRPRSSGEPDLDEMKPFPEIWPTEPGLFVYHEILVSLRLGAGVGSGPEFRTVPLHPWNPKGNKNPPPAYRLGKKHECKWFHVAPGKGVGGLLQSPGRRRPRSKRCPDRPRSSGEPDLDEMKPFPEIWPTEPGLFVYHEILVSLRLGAGVRGQALSFVPYPFTPGTPNVTRTHHRRTG